MGIGSVITVVFVVAKLAAFIDWSWWLVFLPLIIEWSIAIAFLSFGVALMRRT